MSEAACKGRWWLFDSTLEADHQAARTICAQCPELLPCAMLLRQVQADTATMRGQGGGPVGTWAGKLLGKSGQRRTLPREHGTDRGYFQHRYRHETACEDCRAAHVAEVDAYNARRRLVETETCGRPPANPATTGTIEAVPEARSQRPLAPRPQPPVQEEVLAVTPSLPSPDAA